MSPRAKKPATKKKTPGKRSRSKKTKVSSETVEFHYIKGPDFKSVHIDGAIGGLTPRGLAHIAFFSERAAIPKKTVSELLPSGAVGEEITSQREGKDGIVRQMEVDVFLTEPAVLDLRNWLNVRLEEFAAAKKAAVARKKAN